MTTQTEATTTETRVNNFDDVAEGDTIRAEGASFLPKSEMEIIEVDPEWADVSPRHDNSRVFVAQIPNRSNAREYTFKITDGGFVKTTNSAGYFRKTVTVYKIEERTPDLRAEADESRASPRMGDRSEPIYTPGEVAVGDTVRIGYKSNQTGDVKTREGTVEDVNYNAATADIHNIVVDEGDGEGGFKVGDGKYSLPTYTSFSAEGNHVRLGDAKFIEVYHADDRDFAVPEIRSGDAIADALEAAGVDYYDPKFDQDHDVEVGDVIRVNGEYRHYGAGEVVDVEGTNITVEWVQDLIGNHTERGVESAVDIVEDDTFTVYRPTDESDKDDSNDVRTDGGVDRIDTTADSLPHKCGFCGARYAGENARDMCEDRCRNDDPAASPPPTPDATTPPDVARARNKDRRVVWEALRDADRDTLEDLFGNVTVEAASTSDEMVGVWQAFAPSIIARRGLQAGVGRPHFDRNHAECKGRMVAYHVHATGDVTVEDVRDAAMNAVEPKASHGYAGP